MPKQIFDLDQIADDVMLEKGLVPIAPPEVQFEVEAIKGPALPDKSAKDLRQLEWISIDNDDSKDLDQLTWADQNKIYIAIADVDALVKKDSAIDRFAKINTTSVYTPTKIYPMLPVRLSTDLTSLNENEDRAAIVTEIDVDQNGKFTSWNIYPAYVRNHHKMTYRKVGALLEANKPTQNAVEQQLFLQSSIAERIKKYRFQQGALDFETLQVEAKPDDKGEINLQPASHNLADSLIENFMIASNVALTKFLKEKQLPTIRRVVKVPKRWDRIVELARDLGEDLPFEPDNLALQKFLAKRKEKDPERFPDLSLSIIKLLGRGEYVSNFPGQSGNEESLAHFDLALQDYGHTTAPNRRYPDIITQRILKSFLYGLPLPYNKDELDAIATQCTEKEDAANKVERRMLKSAAALSLLNKIGTQYDSFVTGKTDKGVWVRTINPPIEGKLVRGGSNVDVGDKLKVKLQYVNVEQGFIDFITV